PPSRMWSPTALRSRTRLPCSSPTATSVRSVVPPPTSQTRMTSPTPTCAPPTVPDENAAPAPPLGAPPAAQGREPGVERRLRLLDQVHARQARLLGGFDRQVARR